MHDLKEKPIHPVRGGGTGGALGARAPPLLGPKILKSALFYPEFPMDKVLQATVPPPTFRRVPPPLSNWCSVLTDTGNLASHWTLFSTGVVSVLSIGFV